jgi:Uma2 family endonuclease
MTMTTTTTALVTPAPVTFPGLTAEEFAARHNGERLELVSGIIKEIPMAGLEHGKICLKIGSLILVHVEAHDLGQVMSNDSFVKTGPDTVRGADVCFYSWERLPKGQPVPVGFHSLAPDLIVEVKSPTDRWVDVFAKIVEYLRAGTRVVVLLDPGKSNVSVYRDDFQDILGVTDTLTLPDVLPGFSVAVQRLFA